MRIVLAPVLALSLVGCKSQKASSTEVPADQETVTCLLKSDTHPACVEFSKPTGPTSRLAAGVHCRESGGLVAESCPTEGLVGLCVTQQDTTQSWTLHGTRRRFMYLPAEFANAEASLQARFVERAAASCATTGTWTASIPE
jgi:hypothetical protein